MTHDNTKPVTPNDFLLRECIDLKFFLAEMIFILDEETRAQLLYEASINLSPETLSDLKTEIIALRKDESEHAALSIAA